ncbi:MAG: hypothetical protein SGI98_01935 [Verrucomicrobiota bacterium]|nr:hypothetical protein [Verrucomicrobiota bacterium]
MNAKGEICARNWRDNLPIVQPVHPRPMEPFRPQTPPEQFAQKWR